MKVRESLVSNSSSTNFIVSFPKKPESAIEVMEMMRLEFGKTINYYNNNAETGAIAARVFEDVGKGKEATLKEIAEWFSARYYYARHDVSTLGSSGWVGKDKYYGTDEYLLNELKELFIEEDELQEKQHKKESKIREKIEVKYGIDYPKDYDRLSDKEKSDFTNKRCKIIDDDKEYKKSRENYLKKSNEIWKRQHLLREKLANIDAKKFMEDNEGKYISLLSYSDNDGEFGCAMEHGDIFQNLPHIAISCH